MGMLRAIDENLRQHIPTTITILKEYLKYILPIEKGGQGNSKNRNFQIPALEALIKTMENNHVPISLMLYNFHSTTDPLTAAKSSLIKKNLKNLRESIKQFIKDKKYTHLIVDDSEMLFILVKNKTTNTAYNIADNAGSYDEINTKNTDKLIRNIYSILYPAEIKSLNGNIILIISRFSLTILPILIILLNLDNILSAFIIKKAELLRLACFTDNSKSELKMLFNVIFHNGFKDITIYSALIIIIVSSLASGLVKLFCSNKRFFKILFISTLILILLIILTFLRLDTLFDLFNAHAMKNNF